AELGLDFGDVDRDLFRIQVATAGLGPTPGFRTALFHEIRLAHGLRGAEVNGFVCRRAFRIVEQLFGLLLGVLLVAAGVDEAVETQWRMFAVPSFVTSECRRARGRTEQTLLEQRGEREVTIELRVRGGGDRKFAVMAAETHRVAM